MKLICVMQTLIFAAIALAMTLVARAAPPPAVTPTIAPSMADTPYDPTRPAAVVTPAVVPAIPAAQPRLPLDAVRSSGGKSFLWEVKSKTNVVYLFGTIHVGKRTFYPLPPQVEEALRQSPRLVVEADISNSEGLGEIGTIIKYQAPDSLDKHIPPPLFARLKTQLARLNILLDAVKSMKPYLIAGFLSIAEFSKLGYDMNFGVDSYLIGKAKQDGKAILELESQVGQLNMLNDMSPALQEAFLENAISTLESGKAPDQVTGVVNAWQSGDENLMQEVSKSANKGMRMNDQLDEVLLYSRHEGMLKKIDTYLEGREPYFVAVGSLHLAGPRGLVQLLKARGYEVKQL